jgi:hypothetical protein
VHFVTASASIESYTLPRPRAVADGNLESERVAVGEALAHDGAEGVMEKIGGRGSDTRPIFATAGPRVPVVRFSTGLPRLL